LKTGDQINLKNGGGLIKCPPILLWLFLFSLLASFTFCGHTKFPEVPCTVYLSDSITFPCQTRIFNSIIYGPDKKSNIYFYNNSDNHKVIRLDGKGSIIDTITYSIPSGKITGFCAITEDSFAFLQKKGLFLYNSKSKNVREFKISRHGMNCYTIPYVFPLEVSGNLAFFYSYQDTLALNTKKNWELNVESTYDETVFNLNTGHIENIKAGGYPKEIYDDSNCYLSWWPIRCLNYQRHELVYLYPQSDLLYIYNYLNNVLRKVEIRNPEFSQSDKFDFDKLTDFNYQLKYQAENCRNEDIKYNKFKNEYYIVFVPKGSYENTNTDEVTPSLDNPWSILVLDSNFTIKTKINFPAKKYDFISILPLQKGFLVGDYSNINSQTNSSKYAVFEF
jgi:hypothetical protein